MRGLGILVVGVAFGLGACAGGGSNTPPSVGSGSGGTCRGCRSHGSTGSGGGPGSSTGSSGSGSTTGGSTGGASSSGGATSGGTASGGSTSGTTGGATGSSSGTTGSTGGVADAGCNAGSDTITSNGATFFSCNGTASYPPNPACVGASFGSILVDSSSCSPLDAIAIEALDGNGTPISGVAASSATCNGGFSLCLPADATFTAVFTGVGYPTTYFAEAHGQVAYEPEIIELISSTFVAAAEGQVPGIGASSALIGAVVAGGSKCPDSSGWSAALSMPDGGPMPDGGATLVYLGPNGLPDSSLAATSSVGGILYFNVDSSLSNFLNFTIEKADAGSCAPTNLPHGYTGRVYVQPNAVSYDVFSLP